MLKKSSWIVALLLALTVTALFTGCIDALEPEEEMTYTEVALPDFNAWGGQGYQRGWAVAGFKFLGVGDKAEVAADNGYKNDDFGNATKLKIEMADDTHPSGNLDIIYGIEYADGTGEGWVQTGGIPFKKDGKVIVVDLTKMKGYAKYKDKTVAKRKLILQAGGESAGLTKLVVKAWLMIPDKVPFVPVTGMSLAKNSFFWTGALNLEGVFTPEDATNQLVKWSIKGWRSADGLTTITLPDSATDPSYASTKALLLAKVDFKPKTLILRPAVAEVKQGAVDIWDYTVLPPVKITVPTDDQVLVEAVPAFTYPWHEDSIIIAKDGINSMGTVTVVATVTNGKKDPVGTVAGEDFTAVLTVSILDVLPFDIKVNGVTQTVGATDYLGVANSGASSAMSGLADRSGYSVNTIGNGYGNAYHYFKVDFGSENIGDYTGIRFKYKAVAGDANYKTVRVKAALAPPPSGYNPGLDISRLKTGDAASGVNLTAVLGDNADNTPTVTGAYSANITTLSSSSVIYVWFLPWSDTTDTTFEITNIEFYK